jgi:hypothetical protein
LHRPAQGGAIENSLRHQSHSTNPQQNHQTGLYEAARDQH